MQSRFWHNSQGLHGCTKHKGNSKSRAHLMRACLVFLERLECKRVKLDGNPRLAQLLVGDDTCTARKRLKKLTQKSARPGQATLAEIVAVDKSVSTLMGHGLEEWLPSRPLTPWNAEATPMRASEWKEVDFCIDQASTGGASTGFLERRLLAKTTFDFCHRVANDIHDGFIAA
eukprot:9270200-Alexandrium_andersonii.AAC.1